MKFIIFLVWMAIILALVGYGWYIDGIGRSPDERAGAAIPYGGAAVIFIVGLVFFTFVGVLS